MATAIPFSPKNDVLPAKTPPKIIQHQQAHDYFHYPFINGATVSATPYLTLPIKKSDVIKNGKVNYDVYQGWIYGEDELSIHGGNPVHAGFDIALPFGTQVFSPVDGYAMSTYQTFWKKDAFGNVIRFKGQPLRMGLGYFVYMYVPSVNRFVELAHLSDIDPLIPFSKPIYKDGGWMPTGNKIKIEGIEQNPNFVFVTKGTPLGRVGYSGLALGTAVDYEDGNERPVVMPQEQFKSWDIPHIHMEEFYIEQETFKKAWQRDPYAVYSTSEYYKTPNRNVSLGKDQLFLLDDEGFPQFAAE